MTLPLAVLTSLLLALFWATVGTSFLRLRWRVSHDQLAALWIMTVFGATLLTAPILFNGGWRAGAGFSALAAVLPAAAHRIRFRGMSAECEERWSVAAYAGLLLSSAMAVVLNGRIFVQDLRAIGGPSGAGAGAVLLACVLVVGIAGVASALQLRARAFVARREALSNEEFGRLFPTPKEAMVGVSIRELLERWVPVDVALLRPEDRFCQDLHLDARDGLDPEEFLRSVEERWRIAVPRSEAEGMTTIGQLASAIARRLNIPQSEGAHDERS